MNMTILSFDFICTQPVPFYQHLCNQLLIDSQDTGTNANTEPADVLSISINSGYIKDEQYRYRIEAQGIQTHLEALAERISGDFLLSVHLIRAEVAPLKEAKGHHTIQPISELDSEMIDAINVTEPTESRHLSLLKKVVSLSAKVKNGNLLANRSLPQLTHLDYCNTCTPRFGDNQSSQFGDISIECERCHGEQANQGDGQIKTPTFTKADIIDWAKMLLSQQIVTIDTLGLTLSMVNLQHQPDITTPQNPQVLICNPNTLSHSFHATSDQVITLSCMEKPAIALFSKLDDGAPCCDVRFAYNRALIILTEYLRIKGVDWIYYTSNRRIPKMAFIGQHWIWLQQPHNIAVNVPHHAAQKVLHDDATVSDYHAQSIPNRITTEHISSINDNSRNQPNITHSVKPDDQAFNALYAGQLAYGKHPKNDTVMIFLSHQYPSQVISSNRFISSSANTSHGTGKGHIEKDNASSILRFPILPKNGIALIEQLRHSVSPNIAAQKIKGNLLTERNIVDKFKFSYPTHYVALSQLQLGEHRQGLHALLVIVAAILGQFPPRQPAVASYEDSMTNQQANHYAVDRLLRLAEVSTTEHSPRIDFPWQDQAQEAPASFDWCQTFKSLMSFCLAEPAQAGEEHDKNDAQRQAHIARLGFGFLDSLADEMTKWVEQTDHQVGVKQVLLAGEDCRYSLFMQRLHRRLSVNYSVSTLYHLDLEGANLAAGALYLPQRRLG